MKNKIIIISVAVLLAAGIAAWLSVSKKSGPSDGYLSSNLTLLDAKQTFEETLAVNDTLLRFVFPVVDLGKMKMRQKKDVVFRFTNINSTPQVITKVVTTCGCTSADWSKRPIMPGAESEIKVAFEAETDGVFFKKLLVYCAGLGVPLEIAIKGEVR